MNKNDLKEWFYKEREIKSSQVIIGQYNKTEYKLAHVIEEDKEKNEYAITVKVIIPKDSKIIKKAKEKNTSPVTQLLRKYENEQNKLIKEEKTKNNIYDFE